MKQHKRTAHDVGKRILIGLLLFVMAMSLLAPIYAAETPHYDEYIVVSNGTVYDEVMDADQGEIVKEFDTGSIYESDGSENSQDGTGNSQDTVTEVPDDNTNAPAEQETSSVNYLVIALMIAAAVAVVILLITALVVMRRLKTPTENLSATDENESPEN